MQTLGGKPVRSGRSNDLVQHRPVSPETRDVAKLLYLHPDALALRYSVEGVHVIFQFRDEIISLSQEGVDRFVGSLCHVK